MFKSKEANDSQFLNNLTLSRLNETCNGKPQLTSTPLNSPSSRRKPVLPPAIAKHATPRRYSLSEVSSPSRKIIPKPTTSNSPGPLLASLTLKDNVSMYQETKSSGLARRIVQYNEETDKKNRKHYTHQEQYGSPGLFPVVHLFRKKLPSMERTPERIRPKLSSPEYLKSLSPMINKNLDRSHLLDDLMRSRYPRQSSLPAYSQNGVETKSVLEALKEISRKRIHSSEEYEAMDTGKRAKTDPHNGTATNKRTRVDSPPLNSSGSPSSKQSQKKFCNEFDASKSSSNLPILNKTGSPKSLKRKTTSTSTESLENGRQVKVVAVETQTPITLPRLKEKSPEIVEEVIVKELPEKPKPMVRIFDNAFVDNYRGKRLSALMGTAFDKDISVDVSEPESVIVEEPTEVQSPITSILSSPKSNKQNTEKHVHFNEITTATAPLLDQPSLTQTSVPTVTPIIVSKSPVEQQNVDKVSDSITTPVVSTAPTFSFGNATSADKTDASKPSETSPQKLGGFKFDLKAPVSTAAKTTSPSISFPIIATSANTVTFSKPSESSVIVFGSSSTTTTAALKTTEPSLAFGNALAKSPAISFGANTTVSSENKAPSFSFTNTPSTAPSFGITSTTTTSAAPAISFGTSTAAPAIIFGTSTAAPALVTPSINFTGQSTAQPAFNFASNKPTTAPPSMFGSNTTTATVTPTFGSPQVSKSSTVFGSGTTTTSAPTFGNTTSVFGTAPVTSAPAFGSGTAASSAFGAPASVFGTPATTASVFGATSPAAPAFGSTASVFGSAPATCAPMMFGSAKATTAAPMFGSATTTTSAPPTFGSTASSFGSTPAPVFSGFGAKPTPAFGSTQATPAPVFGANSAPTFANKNNVFGATTQAPPPAYGSPNANSTFGQPQSLFGAAAFGGTTTTTSVTSFGTTSTFSFGANKPATTNPFGTTTTTSNSTFGTANAFSATTKSGSTFGANTFSGGGFSASAPSSTFGSTNAPVFGQTDNKASFAFGGGETKTNSNVFGTAASAFSKPSGFGGAAAAATSGFGTANAARPQVNGGFNFGSNTAAAPFAFGGASGTGASEPAKPSFSFGGSTNPAPAFGNPNAAPAFGTPPPSFAAPAFSATGTPGAGAGIFNIGAGSTGGRPRTQLRAKRRT